MIEFILNDTLIKTDQPLGLPLLDFIRSVSGLTGTKTGCREGDCGACAVIMGEILNDELSWKTIVSCLTPLGAAANKHIVTIEGLNGMGLSPVQEAIINHSATQCGFCTPGIVISLTAFILSGDFSNPENILESIDGNICRCTGYKSLEKAALSLYAQLPENEPSRLDWMVKNHFLPSYFSEIKNRLQKIEKPIFHDSSEGITMGGGTDLMVRDADKIVNSGINLTETRPELVQIRVDNNICSIGGAVTVTQILQSDILNARFRNLKDHFKLISSTPVRNRATLGGNIANASPIGDLTIFFLALDAMVVLENRKKATREIALKDFFKGYKILDKEKDELIKEIQFRLPQNGEKFNFEKVSKRQHLDIASVNSAMFIEMNNTRIEKVHLSAGGVAPVPLYLAKTCHFLTGKELTEKTLFGAVKVMISEISPISDIRGSADYKQLLLRQLFLAHFTELFPGFLNYRLIIQKLQSNEKY
jgi:xanthine dehydrogenase small subunit